MVKKNPTSSTLQTGIGEIHTTLKNLVRQINHRFDKQEKFSEFTRSEFNNLRKEMNTRFNNQEKRFFEWKSEVHNLTAVV